MFVAVAVDFCQYVFQLPFATQHRQETGMCIITSVSTMNPAGSYKNRHLAKPGTDCLQKQNKTKKQKQKRYGGKGLKAAKEGKSVLGLMKPMRAAWLISSLHGLHPQYVALVL